MNDYEAQRQRNIQRNRALIDELGLPAKSATIGRDASKPPAPKRRKLSPSRRATRASARLAVAPDRLSYDERDSEERGRRTKPVARSQKPIRSQTEDNSGHNLQIVQGNDVEELKTHWSSWDPTGPAPSRDQTSGTFHFADWPSFAPNKAPAEMLHEGVFGGSFFRPLYSKRLGVTIEDDWKELPSDWIEGLKVDQFIASRSYDPEVNKYKASCGQSIEQWEENGWINHQHDVRGWFQWYCRFFQGRRCDDDERQIGRWARCVGERGRWRRTLLKKYGQLGIKSVMADMDDGDGDEDKPDVSPTVHQTCLQWGFEVRQATLDEYWATL